MTGLTPEEKRRIYEEEKVKLEAQERTRRKIRRKTKPATWGCLILIILIVIVFITIISNVKIEKSRTLSPSKQLLESKIKPVKKTKKESINWRNLADNLIKDYQGKITSIKQLNSTTCWAILSSNLSNDQAVKIAESIGYYIKNVTKSSYGKEEKPSIHVFLRNKHVAIARPSLDGKYNGKIKIENWNAWNKW